MRNRHKLIVFDWDGTLMDSQARIVACLRASADDLGAERRSDAELADIIGLGLEEAWRALYPNAERELLAAMVERYRYHFLIADDTPSPLFPGVEALLAGLEERGYLLAVATGKARRGLDRVLAESGLGHYFHATRCADETRSKPHPQMLLELIEVTGVEAHETVMVGDTEYDMLLAHNAATAAIAVSYGVHDIERLRCHRPLAEVDSLAGLLHYFGESLHE